MENRYDKYKDSGIAWIGEIPEHWEVKRLKYFGNNYNGLTYSPNDICSSQEGIIVLRSSNIKDNKLCFDDNVYVNKEIPTKLLVNKGDILICSRNGSASLIGKAALIETDIKATFGAFMMIFKGNNICHKYLYYIVTSCISQYKWLFTTATINQLTSSMLGEIFAPFICNKLEQQSIAAYLDQKCGEIDELITLQEEMITKLQSYKQSIITEAVTKGLDKNVLLKDSGIEWIGEIPKHWIVKRLKFSCNIWGRIGFRGYKSDDLVPEGEGAITLSPSNMKDMKMDYTNRTYLSWKKYYESPEIMISNNDILMVKTGSTYGKCSFVENMPMECTINPQIVVFKQHKDNSKFLAYSFQTRITRAFVETSVVGGTIPTIAQEKIMNYFFAFPPLSEQQSIVNYLDQRCGEIDELISIKQQKIEKLKEYKKSLIFECVTGKRKVC